MQLTPAPTHSARVSAVALEGEPLHLLPPEQRLSLVVAALVRTPLEVAGPSQPVALGSAHLVAQLLHLRLPPMALRLPSPLLLVVTLPLLLLVAVAVEQAQGQGAQEVWLDRGQCWQEDGAWGHCVGALVEALVAVVALQPLALAWAWERGLWQLWAAVRRVWAWGRKTQAWARGVEQHPSGHAHARQMLPMSRSYG